MFLKMISIHIVVEEHVAEYVGLNVEVEIFNFIFQNYFLGVILYVAENVFVYH